CSCPCARSIAARAAINRGLFCRPNSTACGSERMRNGSALPGDGQETADPGGWETGGEGIGPGGLTSPTGMGPASSVTGGTIALSTSAGETSPGTAEEWKEGRYAQPAKRHSAPRSHPRANRAELPKVVVGKHIRPLPFVRRHSPRKNGLLAI